MTMPQEPTPRTEGPTPRADVARAGMSAELHDITHAVNTLIEHMDTSLPEERVQAVLDAALAEERHGRRRLMWTIISPVIVAIIVAGGAWLQSISNHQQNDNVAVVANYVRHCLQHKTAGVSAQQLRDECGDPANQSAFFVTYMNCALKIEPTKRTDQNLDACVQKGVAATSGK